jgi:hypothetical protein
MTLQQFADTINTTSSSTTINTTSTSTGKLLQHRKEENIMWHHTLLRDFGFPFQQIKNMEFIDSKIREIEKNFNLILIQERFDESIILLKDLLCWDNTDILHLKLNPASSKKSELSEETRRSLETYLEVDIRLYNYFYKKFIQKIQTFGESKIKSEIVGLKEDIKKNQKDCGIKKMKSTNQSIDRHVMYS